MNPINQEVKTVVENLEVVKPVIKSATKLSKVLGRTSLILQKHSPEILLGVGVIGVVGSAILACRATLKVEEVVDRSNGKIKMIKDAKENFAEVEYSEQDYQKDLTVTYVQTAVDFVLLYGPAVTLGVASIGCIIGSHGIMKKRGVALMAACKALEEGFNAYRNRVRDEFGDEKDYMFKHGLYSEEVIEEITDENGKKKKVKKTQLVGGNDGKMGLSIYAREFDKASTREWSPAEHYNLAYVTSQQSYFNSLLTSRGHVFLNEVYDALGFKRSKEGQLVGWVLDSGGDNYIDFGLNNEFLGSNNSHILLDFNVDGMVYDLI